jgi:hypothetical protein
MAAQRVRSSANAAARGSTDTQSTRGRPTRRLLVLRHFRSGLGAEGFVGCGTSTNCAVGFVDDDGPQPRSLRSLRGAPRIGRGECAGASPQATASRTFETISADDAPTMKRMSGFVAAMAVVMPRSGETECCCARTAVTARPRRTGHYDSNGEIFVGKASRRSRGLVTSGTIAAELVEGRDRPNHQVRAACQSWAGAWQQCWLQFRPRPAGSAAGPMRSGGP